MNRVAIAILLVAGCKKTEAVREAPPPLPPPSASVIEDQPPPSMSLRQFLGLRRSRNESLLGTRPESTDNGWVAYGGSWRLRYAAGCAVELEARRPKALECAHAINVLGFDPGTAMKPGACEWKTAVEHGTYDSATGLVTVRRAPGACGD